MQVGAVDAGLNNLEASTFLRHFQSMMGPYGLYQHATIREPLLSEGYCTDDNARAVQLLARLLPLALPNDREIVRALLMDCWKFLVEARIRPGYFYNFRDSGGQWLPHGQSEDMYARLIRALAAVLNNQGLVDLHAEAAAMLKPILVRAPDMQAPRFWAECLVVLADFPDEIMPVHIVKSLVDIGQGILADAWEKHSTPDWRWFEDTMTYANALLPHGLLATSGHNDILRDSARFLIETTVQDDMFVPVGSVGWYPKGGAPSHDNQQAIEAGTMFDFLLAYNANRQASVSSAVVAAPYLWFFGRNTNSAVMADRATGACLDGLFLEGPNPNYGAESMLAYLWTELLLRDASQDIKDYIRTQMGHLSHRRGQ
ncbi:MAG: hypothetical protein WEC84_01720 [Candidatus Andersenbacteria bacterium]